ncbi:hypothetical protein, partial [Paraburkholderia sabiae]|uniref:hypothetical protein n=1 Tax=Paraburkholderia sabiae TaxID=273251 RepID=UPI001CC7A89C
GQRVKHRKQNADASEKQKHTDGIADPHQKAKTKTKNRPQGKQLHDFRIAAIVAGMALSKFPFLSLQASTPLLGELALARLPR